MGIPALKHNSTEQSQGQGAPTLNRRFACLGLLALAGCGIWGDDGIVRGADGAPLKRLYRIKPEDTARVQFAFLDGVNSLRQAKELPPVQLNALLNAAAATHSQDMAMQNRPWHFGSDRSSPVDRVKRVGYKGTLLGENISETRVETELETLAAWLQLPSTRDVILDPRAEEIGISWFQEETGKIWWTFIAAVPDDSPRDDIYIPPNIDRFRRPDL